MNDCEKKGCNLCRINSTSNGHSHIDGQTPHPEVTDVKNRELLLFLLVIIIMAAIGFSGFIIYDKLTSSRDSNANITSTVK